MKVQGMPTVSILMNGFNAELFLKDAIDSVYAQTFSNWEIVFVDNCSTDSTSKIIKQYDSKIRYFKTHQNIPLGEARNFGLKHCNGEYIAFLDCDDIYLPDKLEKQISLMQSGGYEMCYASTFVINENGREIGKRLVKNKSGNVFSSLLRRYEISMLTVVLKSKFIADNRLHFNTSMSYSPDHNLFMIAATKARTIAISDIVAKYRVWNGSLSRKTIDIAPKEYQLTLDALSAANPALRKQLSHDFECAYNKVKYYEAVSFIYNNDRNGARKKLKEIMMTRLVYFLLFILLFFPISNNSILKLLGR